MDFGFTDDKTKLDAAHSYRNEAVLDGWRCTPTYGNSEPMKSAAKLYKDGFVMMIVSRDRTEKGFNRPLYEASVSIWCPKGIAIVPPVEYNWVEIQENTRLCGYCLQKKDDCERVGFAGRCCQDCLPEVRKKIEYPGWSN